MFRVSAIGAICFLAWGATPAFAVCSWSTITPGTTASATQVMNNFDCLAPLSVPSFGGRVSIAPNTAFQPSSLAIQRGAMGGLASDQAGITYQHNGGISGLNEAFVFDTGTSGNDYKFKTGNNDRLVINGTSGAMGIGMSSPAFRLDVETTGNTPAKFGNAYPIYLINNAPIVGFNLYADSGFKFGKTSASAYGAAIGANVGNGNMDFYTVTAPGSAGAAATVASRFTIAQAGNIGIGTTSPGQKLHVSGTIRQTGCTTAGTLSVNSSGDIICTSDARLKNVRGPYTLGLDAIGRLAPQLFSFKPSDNNRTETFVHAGFIAQNVKSAIPEAVALQKSGYYSLDTTAILAASVNAIKELKVENQKLRHEISFMRAAQGTQYRELSMRLAALARGREEKALNVSASGEAQGAAPVKRRGS